MATRLEDRCFFGIGGNTIIVAYIHKLVAMSHVAVNTSNSSGGLTDAPVDLAFV